MDTHHNRAHIVVDNSNLFISAGKYQAQQTGLEDGNADPRLRVDYREMWAMLCEMHGAEGQGSMTVCAGEGVPPSVWAALSAGGVRIDMHPRERNGSEKRVDVAACVGAVDAAAAVFYDPARVAEREHHYTVFVTGDSDFRPAVKQIALHYGMHVTIAAFSNALAGTYKELQAVCGDRLRLIVLDNLMSRFTYVAYATTRVAINPERTVLINVGAHTSETVAHALLGTRRRFYCHPLQDDGCMPVEFPTVPLQTARELCEQVLPTSSFVVDGRQTPLPCPNGVRCQLRDTCPLTHTDSDYNLWRIVMRARAGRSVQSFDWSLWKSRKCDRQHSHPAATCSRWHDGDEAWCVVCRCAGHLTAACPHKKKEDLYL